MEKEEKISGKNNENNDVTVAELLRNARTQGRRKREISTIAKQLCIAEEFLEALENGDYKKIPEIVYVLGFARNYAIELGLDPDMVVNKVKEELGIEPECETTITNEDLEEMNKSIDYKAKIQEWTRIAVNYVMKHWLWFAIGGGILVLAMLVVIIFGGSAADVDDANVAAPVVEKVENVVE